MAGQRALLGLHHDLSFKAYCRQLQQWGFDVERAASLEEMQERHRQQHHDLYIMDLNLGKPGSPDVTPAREFYSRLRVYSQLKPESGEARFYGVSGNMEAVESAQAAGIPAVIINELMSRLKEDLGKE